MSKLTCKILDWQGEEKDMASFIVELFVVYRYKTSNDIAVIERANIGILMEYAAGNRRDKHGY